MPFQWRCSPPDDPTAVRLPEDASLSHRLQPPRDPPPTTHEHCSARHHDTAPAPTKTAPSREGAVVSSVPGDLLQFPVPCLFRATAEAAWNPDCTDDGSLSLSIDGGATRANLKRLSGTRLRLTNVPPVFHAAAMQPDISVTWARGIVQVANVRFRSALDSGISQVDDGRTCPGQGDEHDAHNIRSGGRSLWCMGQRTGVRRRTDEHEGCGGRSTCGRGFGFESDARAASCKNRDGIQSGDDIRRTNGRARCYPEVVIPLAKTPPVRH
jgi:hypothetical protein